MSSTARIVKDLSGSVGLYKHTLAVCSRTASFPSISSVGEFGTGTKGLAPGLRLSLVAVSRAGVGLASVSALLEHIAGWCLPLHLEHWCLERQSHTMWPRLRQTKHLPPRLRACLLSSGVFLTLQFTVPCCWPQKAHWGSPS